MNIVLYTQQIWTKRTRLCTAAIFNKQLYRLTYWKLWWIDSKQASWTTGKKNFIVRWKKSDDSNGRRLVVIWCNSLGIIKNVYRLKPGCTSVEFNADLKWMTAFFAIFKIIMEQTEKNYFIKKVSWLKTTENEWILIKFSCKIVARNSHWVCIIMRFQFSAHQAHNFIWWNCAIFTLSMTSHSLEFEWICSIEMILFFVRSDNDVDPKVMCARALKQPLLSIPYYCFTYVQIKRQESEEK